MEIVPIGDSCSVAYNASLLGYRKIAYPFDWIKTKTLNDVSRLLENHFSNFFDQLSIVKYSNKFPFSTTDEFPYLINDYSQIVKNESGILFCHDFRSQLTINEQLSMVEEKYNRRITRLYEILNSGILIHFIRDETKSNSLTPSMIENFLRVMNKLNINYYLTIISKKIIVQQYRNVKIVNDLLPFGDWMRPNVDWSNVFSNVFSIQ